MERPRPRLLLLHGFLSGRAAWGPLRRELADLDTIAPDLLGYGASPRHRAEYSLDEMVRYLEPLVSAERPAFVLGHSMGAIVALALAAAMPGAFSRVGVVGLPVYNDRADGMSFLRARPVHHAFLRRDVLSHAGCVAMHHSRSVWLPFSPLVLPRQPRSVLNSTFDHCRQSHVGSLESIVFAGRVPELVSRIETPVVALHGARDRSAPLDRVRRLAEEAGWDLTLAPRCGHQVVVERPRLVARWVRERLISVPTPESAARTHRTPASRR